MSLSLSAIEPSEYRAVHSICTRPEVAFWLGGHPADPPEMWQKRLSDADPRRFVRIGARLNGRLIGLISLELMSARRIQHIARLWMAVEPEQQRQGIGQQLLESATDSCDRWLRVDRLELNTYSDNEAAIRLMARIRPGFIPPSAPPLLSPARPQLPGPIDLSVRPATPDDGPAVAALFQDESELSGTLQTPFTPGAFWRQRISNQSPEFQNLILAEVGDQVVGLVGLFGSNNPRRAHSRDLFISVARAFQGIGVGDRLMSAALDLADNWIGARRIELTVNIDNLRAIRLYERHGFVVEGRKRYEAFRDGGFIDGLAMARYHVNSAG
jgi:putative acetyltransferase